MVLKQECISIGMKPSRISMPRFIGTDTNRWHRPLIAKLKMS